MTLVFTQDGNVGTITGTLAIGANQVQTAFNTKHIDNLGVLVHSTHVGTVEIQQSPDGVVWYSSSFPIVAGVVTACWVDIVGLFARVKITNAGAAIATIAGDWKIRLVE